MESQGTQGTETPAMVANRILPSPLGDNSRCLSQLHALDGRHRSAGHSLPSFSLHKLCLVLFLSLPLHSLIFKRLLHFILFLTDTRKYTCIYRKHAHAHARAHTHTGIHFPYLFCLYVEFIHLQKFMGGLK